MKGRELAFSTFLKLLELPDPQKVTTMRGFLRGGGFNYWRPLQELAPEVVVGTLGLGDIQDKVGLMAKGHQRRYNERALTNLLKWISRRKIQRRKQPPRLVKKFGNTGLMVRLQPEVAFAMDGRNYLMHVWATTNPTLSEETLSMGLHFFRFHSREAGCDDFQFLIFDSVKDRIFAEFNVLQNAAFKLAEQRKLLSDLWSALNGDAEMLPESDRPLDRSEDHAGQPI